MTDTRIPFLIWTDAPDKSTGLARICRDLVAHIQADPQTNSIFRIGTCGFFGQGSSRFPWTQYMSSSVEEGLIKLPSIWEDFTQNQKGFGILFTITPPSWIFPLGCPDLAAQEKPQLKTTWDYLMRRPFDIWSYFAIETHSPNSKYSLPIVRLMESVDRGLYYSQWGAQIAANCRTSGSPFSYIPHGIFCDTFIPPPPDRRAMIRADLGAELDGILIGCIATNTVRKNLGLLFESFYLLKQTMKKGRPHLWLHTDIGIRDWSIPALLGDLDLDEKTEVRITSTLANRSDNWLASMMGSCDVMVMPTDGEGFGYPCVESLSCGTPLVTNSFGAQTQFLDGWRDTWICPYVSLNVWGPNNLVRPSYRPMHFAEKILTAVHDLRSNPTTRSDCRAQALKWDWPNVWPGWRQWLLEGIPAGHPLKPKLELIEIKESSVEPPKE